ncbi:hypothetical protein N7510_000601 [Penicillium lagena]|uniref:uncharacterized protein n=1 Tax=Penicillium lagena TaxID=94218 RepID=UPI00253FC0DF|nr:uncharacterized protein N7510_000601 [Penicillium lagena]KAJ5624292.1 hypothetical protein N7510_000601 [Penicillium lagena]
MHTLSSRHIVAPALGRRVIDIKRAAMCSACPSVPQYREEKIIPTGQLGPRADLNPSKTPVAESGPSEFCACTYQTCSRHSLAEEGPTAELHIETLIRFRPYDHDNKMAEGEEQALKSFFWFKPMVREFRKSVADKAITPSPATLTTPETGQKRNSLLDLPLVLNSRRVARQLISLNWPHPRVTPGYEWTSPSAITPSPVHITNEP